MARKRGPRAPELPPEQEEEALRGRLKRRGALLAALTVGLGAVLSWTGAHLLEPVRRHRERMDLACAAPLSAAGATPLGEVHLLSGALAARPGPRQLVDSGRALYLVDAAGRAELVADRCRRSPGGEP
ncbi:MAG: hypothetical protein IT382_16810 [Deltaproteobacteria bacterium]|nr:hypothetical protein [Deltaproteobacteria bacterium]